MTIDDLKLDELENFAKVFREIDIQYIQSLDPSDRLAYINGMLNTSIAQSSLLSFRLHKLGQLFIEAYKNICDGLSKVFGNVAEAFKRMGS